MPIPLITPQFCGSSLSGVFWLAETRSGGYRPCRLPEVRQSGSRSLKRYIASLAGKEVHDFDFRWCPQN